MLSVSCGIRRVVVFVFNVPLFVGLSVIAQQNPGALGPRHLQDAAVKVALSAVEESESDVLDDQVELCEIPAPPFLESVRAEAYRDRFEQLGLTEVRIDAVGNVIGVRAGKQRRPNLVMSAHLDTVFPEDTDVTVVRDGTILKGPGIGYD